MSVLSDLKRKLEAIWPHLDERTRRLTAANEAISLGYGGVSLVSRASGLSRVAIHKGIREIQEGDVPPPGRVRRSGAGRKSITHTDPRIVDELDKMIEGGTQGDPESPLRWICKSTRSIAAALSRLGHPVSHVKVGQLLHAQDYSLQSNFRTKEGGDDHPDRDAQFRHISAEVKKYLTQGLPVISVDTKKKLVGNYKSQGRQWLPEKRPIPVNAHDSAASAIPRAYPYGIYDMGKNTGFVNVGTDHDTEEFAVASIRGWWRAEGRRLYPKTDRILITANGEGGNGYRLRLWKLELQQLADDTGLKISVSHFPPGTSKWNKMEHRLFSFISSNWRGEPLQDCETIVNLIARTTTAKGLTVTCRLDRRKYAKGRTVSDKQMKELRLKRSTIHGEWNYAIHPRAA